jgi:hypothetical protein
MPLKRPLWIDHSVVLRADKSQEKIWSFIFATSTFFLFAYMT